MSLVRSAVARLRHPPTPPPEQRYTFADYAAQVSQFLYQGNTYPITGLQQTLTTGGQQTESSGPAFTTYAWNLFGGNGIVFACMLARQLAYSSVRFRWQQMRNGKPADMFGTADLDLLDRPWPNGTTQDLLTRVIQDADLAGNAYLLRDGTEIVRLRPDWVDIVVTPRVINGGRVGWRRVGYIYTEGGLASENDPVPFLTGDVAHFAPIPDPLATYRGMSWLTPVIREVRADQEMIHYKDKFFTNGATPNMIVKHPEGATQEAIRRFAELMDARHTGYDNAFRTLNLYPGADAEVVGSNFTDMDFSGVQGGGEVRIAAAARVPPVILGLSEGLQGSSLNQGNYASARRQFADGTMHPLWSSTSGTFETLIPPPRPGVRLWYDASGVPLLREDRRDAADIASVQAQTIRSLVDTGYTPDSVQAAVEADADWRLLEHTGLFSVQLQAPGSDTVTNNQPAEGEE